jgi:uncharacterized protein HemY
VKKAEDAQAQLAAEREENAANAERLEGLTRLETKHRKALRLLGEYHCRIQALTAPGQRFGTMNVTK